MFNINKKPSWGCWTEYVYIGFFRRRNKWNEKKKKIKTNKIRDEHWTNIQTTWIHPMISIGRRCFCFQVNSKHFVQTHTHTRDGRGSLQNADEQSVTRNGFEIILWDFEHISYFDRLILLLEWVLPSSTRTKPNIDRRKMGKIGGHSGLEAWNRMHIRRTLLHKWN